MTQQLLEGTPLEVRGKRSVLNIPSWHFLERRTDHAVEQGRDHHLEIGNILRLSILVAWKRTIRKKSELKARHHADG
jgi:hypothetical protein